MGLLVPHGSSLPLLWLGLMVSATAQSPVAKPVEDAFAGRVESARQSRDDAQLNSLKAEFEKRVAEKV